MSPLPSSEISRLEKEYEEALESEDLGKIADSYSKLLSETIKLNNEEVSRNVSKFIEETSQIYSDTLEKAKEKYILDFVPKLMEVGYYFGEYDKIEVQILLYNSNISTYTKFIGGNV